jgi:tetratricopeptide (TPR) repeat protein
MAGSVIARAVRLEAAGNIGEILADAETYVGFSREQQACYGAEELIAGKRDEVFSARRYTVVSGLVTGAETVSLKSTESTAETPSTPNNLPRLPYFFGRDKELATIADALTPQRRTWGALIDGPGGMGKTSLAIRAAELVPDGQFNRILFLSAKAREMTADGEKRLTGFIVPGYLEMLNEIARQLKLEKFTEKAETERARILLDALTDEHALLLLDNLESLTPEHRDQLFTFLGNLPQGCKAIVTSRRRTDVDARIIRLEKLDPQAALDYLNELSEGRSHLQKATEAERRRLYEETGGNPLVIRWLVGQLGKGRCKTVAKGLEFLRSAPKENDPLEFIFGDLLETFSESEEKVLAALAYFTSPIEIKHIAELGAISKTAAQTALEDLTDRALVVADAEQQKFVLVPLVADFLRNARPGIIKETGNRLEQHAYALIVENGYQKHDRFPVLDEAWPTVAPAMPLFVAGPNDRLQTICGALLDFLNFTGRWDELLSVNQQAEAKAMAAGDHDNAGWRAYRAGFVHSLRRQADAVLSSAKRATAHWMTARAGARERASALHLLGIGHYLKGDYPAAIAALVLALDLLRTLSTENVEVTVVLQSLAEAEQGSGDLVAAEREYREALRISRALGNHVGVASCIGSLARLAFDQKNWTGAEALAREALPLSEELGHQELIADNCNYLAKALKRQAKADEALPYARRAVEIFTRLVSPELEAALETLRECEA